MTAVDYCECCLNVFSPILLYYKVQELSCLVLYGLWVCSTCKEMWLMVNRTVHSGVLSIDRIKSPSIKFLY